MLSLQQKIKFSSYTSLYELIVPKDNLLRRINYVIDLLSLNRIFNKLKILSSLIYYKVAEYLMRPIVAIVNIFFSILMVYF